jgi:protoporphyrin/coproporphyrin ferrochelatase
MSDPVPYDALLLVSFGGPEGRDEVMPFLRNVVRGRNVPDERLRAVAEHYFLFDGVSPINAENRALTEGVEKELRLRGRDLPVYWGNRNWRPLLGETLKRMASDGVRRALAFVTSGYSSYSSCRQYLDDVARARAETGPGAPAVDKLRPFFNHPGFVAANRECLEAALGELPGHRRNAAPILFTAHSIPLAMAKGCDYAEQLSDVARLVAEGLPNPTRLVYQSRSGPPSQPWLGPDILESIRDTSRESSDLVISPIGFVSDHMEVVYDLDVEARELAVGLGLNLVRAKTAGRRPRFVTMLVDLLEERLDGGEERKSVGALPARPDACPPDCCPRESA